MTEKQEALKEMPNGSDINDIGDWAFKHRNTIRAALTEAPKVDVEWLKKDLCEHFDKKTGLSQRICLALAEKAVDYITTHYDLVKKETPND